MNKSIDEGDQIVTRKSGGGGLNLLKFFKKKSKDTKDKSNRKEMGLEEES